MEELKPYASDRQLEYLAAVAATGSIRKAADSLGVSHQSISQSLRMLRLTAAARGVAPDHDMTHPTAEGFHVRGTSTLYDADGKPTIQWVKTQADKQQQEEALRAFVEGLTEDLGGAKPVKPMPRGVSGDHMTVYPLGDPHIGMYAWADECGESFDLKIAERDIDYATRRLVSCGQRSDLAVILNLGDFLHADNLDNTTRRSGNALDVDTRWGLVMQVGARVLVNLVERALRRHTRVIIRNVIGNHDDQSSQALSLILDAWYRNEPRVEVVVDPSALWVHQFGRVLIASTHGHTYKPAELPMIIAAKYPVMWGETDHRHVLTGHVHHSQSKEHPGIIWESFRTLAAPDAYNAAHHHSGRDMWSLCFHKQYGLVERHRVDIQRVREDQE